jgi:flagellar basal-body rod modification protein FlgD
MISGTQDTSSAATFFATMNANANAKPAAAASAASVQQNQFLKLLVTQMQNQDPNNPMDNAQITSQMAQLSTVTGIDKLNVTLQALSDSMTSNQSYSASSMIGHGVLVAGKGVDLSSGTAIGGYQQTSASTSTQVSIYDKSGALVRNMDLGATPAGINKWQWDGKDNAGKALSDGSYTFAVSSVQGGSNVAATNLQFGMVNSVTQGATGAVMGVGSLNGITMSQVVQIL